jgi:hypothetical protein
MSMRRVSKIVPPKRQIIMDISLVLRVMAGAVGKQPPI